MTMLSPFPDYQSSALRAPTLGSRDIDLWCTSLDLPPASVAQLERFLTDDEVERADRFRFERHRRRFVVSRGTLRLLLAVYADQSPQELRFGYGDKGKPYLTLEDRAVPCFNLSHSDELALIGVTLDEELGVDVELLRPMPDALSIAQHFFSANEIADLSSVPEPRIAQTFFNCWTRKEAYIKAVGDGLSAPLDAFDVTLLPGHPAAMRSLEGDPQKASAWSLYHFEPVPGYIGALAVRHDGWNLRAWNLDPTRLSLS